MKYIIERSTNGEMSKWLENFAGQLKKSAEEFRSGALCLSSDSPSQATRDTTVNTSSNPSSTDPVTPATPSVSNSVEISATKQFAVDDLSRNVPPKTNSSQWDSMVMIVLLLVILFLIIDFWRWNSISSQIREMRSKMSQMESLINSLSALQKKSLINM